ncbi:MAG: hypothetical protein V4466_10670 [Pseudomonadota bacterium]
MSVLQSVMKMFGSQWVSPHEVRAEAWALGSRHMGEVLAGARSELLAPSLSARRTVLLKAVIRAYA